MEKFRKLLKLLLTFLILGCSSDDNSFTNSPKKLAKITYGYADGTIRDTENLKYDAYGNLIEITDADGVVISSYNYNSSNDLIKVVDWQYNDGDSIFEIINNISYNEDNKISRIEELFNVYHPDGSLNYQNSLTKTITYEENLIRSTNDVSANKTTVELILTDTLITGARIFKADSLVAEMNFTYDSEGNCISGQGPYKPGLYDTNDIDLSVTYGNKEKDPFFNIFFDYNVLFNNDSFFLLKEVLINQQGTRYPERIQWYQFENWNYRDYNEYIFDNDGYIVSKITNVLNTNAIEEITSYKWE